MSYLFGGDLIRAKQVNFLEGYRRSLLQKKFEESRGTKLVAEGGTDFSSTLRHSAKTSTSDRCLTARDLRAIRGHLGNTTENILDTFESVITPEVVAGLRSTFAHCDYLTDPDLCGELVALTKMLAYYPRHFVRKIIDAGLLDFLARCLRDCPVSLGEHILISVYVMQTSQPYLTELIMDQELWKASLAFQSQHSRLESTAEVCVCFWSKCLANWSDRKGKIELVRLPSIVSGLLSAFEIIQDRRLAATCLQSFVELTTSPQLTDDSGTIERLLRELVSESHFDRLRQLLGSGEEPVEIMTLHLVWEAVATGLEEPTLVRIVNPETLQIFFSIIDRRVGKWSAQTSLDILRLVCGQSVECCHSLATVGGVQFLQQVAVSGFGEARQLNALAVLAAVATRDCSELVTYLIQNCFFVDFLMSFIPKNMQNFTRIVVETLVRMMETLAPTDEEFREFVGCFWFNENLELLKSIPRRTDYDFLPALLRLQTELDQALDSLQRSHALF